MLEGEDGDDDDEHETALDSSQTQSLSASMLKQMIGSEQHTSLSQNELNEINVYIRELVGQAGFSTTSALT